jgi:Ca-activated chloride channel family protein
MTVHKTVAKRAVFSMFRFSEELNVIQRARLTRRARTADRLHMLPRMKRIVIAALLLVACTSHKAPVITPAPASPGMIRGSMQDSTGVPLPGVTVTVTGVKDAKTAVTDASGLFTFNGIDPGIYTVTASLSGMSQWSHRINVTAMGASLVATMTVGVVETVTVTAEIPTASDPWIVLQRAPSVITDSINVGGAVSQRITVTAGPILPDTATYAHVEDHSFVDTKKERTTTFAIDVDRASYANVRRFLTRGLVPPPDAVRVEEMINYFTYHYPQPADGKPFSITTEVAGCPWNAQSRLLRIGIQGRNLEQWKMAPNNLVFLLDVSGSMEPPDRLPLVKSGMRVLVDQLRAEDRVAIVVYAGAAGLVLPPTSGADKNAILGALDRLQAGGSTAGAEGIELAYKVAKDNFLQDGNNRVILATDGDFNVGVSSIPQLEKIIEAKRKSGIYLSVLGVGDNNLQDALMEMLADKGNGNYAYLDSLKEAEKVFKQELTGTLVTIAKDVKVQLEFDPSLVASYRQIGYENRSLANKDFDDDAKDAGELGAGHSVTALYEIVPTSNAGGTIATIRLRYKEPKEERSKLITASAIDEGKSAYEASPDMQFAAAIAEFGMLLRDSPHKGTASWDDVMQLARIARGEDLEGIREEFVRMLDAAKHVTGPRVAAR